MLKNFAKLFIIVFIVTVFMSANVTRAQIVKDGLVSYWSFDEIKGDTVKDVLGKSDGTMKSDTKQVNGKIGKALEFDGVDDYVDCGNDASLNITDALSIEAWVYMKSAGNYPTVVSKSGANWGYIFEFLTTTRKINLYLDGGVNGWDGPAETPVPLEEWTNIAATYDGKTLQYYFNGEPDGTYNKAGKIASNNDNVHIGGRKVGEPYHFDGIIDEVLIYEKALSEKEAKQNYQAKGMTAVHPTNKMATCWGKIKVSR